MPIRKTIGTSIMKQIEADEKAKKSPKRTSGLYGMSSPLNSNSKITILPKINQHTVL